MDLGRQQISGGATADLERRQISWATADFVGGGATAERDGSFG